MMKTCALDGSWTLRFNDPKTQQPCEIAAQVPGNVIGDLERAGRIADPYYGHNAYLLRPYEFIRWSYERTFTAPRLAPGEKLDLVLEGVDTVFELFINGVKAGSGRNMFISHRFDVTELVKQGEENAIRIDIASSVNEARSVERPMCATAQDYQFEGLMLRRPMHTYGWDIAPRIVGAGLWRSVRLEKLPPTRWTDLYLYTVAVTESEAEVHLDWSFVSDQISLEGFEAELTLRCGDSLFQKKFTPWFTTGHTGFSLPQPKLWWPLGMGGQPLYDVELKLFHQGKAADVRTWKTGIRELELERTDTNLNGEGKFCFIVNHRRLFVKGSNWVPANVIHGEHRERITETLELFKELGCNMVRSWGGSVYEDHDFFDWCDRNGLLVWQDFMLACEMPRQDDAFCKEIAEEAASVIKKLRRHPSLALWCGDNECDEPYTSKRNCRWLPSMNRISREVLKRAVFENDVVRSYLPSSPFLCDEILKAGVRYGSPEQHLWGPRDYWKNSFYTQNTAVFASELGYHGMPSPESVKKFIPTESLRERSAQNLDWLCHAAQPFPDPAGGYAYRIQLMVDQVKNLFGSAADDLETFAEQSQIVQAEAMKYLVESFRFTKWQRTGLIWWNVSDGWPQFSDAVVDYYGAKKLAFYYLKNVQKPVMLGFSEPEAWGIELRAVNDLDHEVKVRYTVTDFASGRELMAGEVKVAADSVAAAGKLKICQAEQRMLRIDFGYDGEKGVNHYWQGGLPLDFEFYRKWLAVARQLYCR